jgi:hypothetical protein
VEALNRGRADIAESASAAERGRFRLSVRREA